MKKKKYTSAEVRAYWQGYGAGLCGLDSFTSKNANLLLDRYYRDGEKTDLQLSVLAGICDGQRARERRYKRK